MTKLKKLQLKKYIKKKLKSTRLTYQTHVTSHETKITSYKKN